MPVWVRIPPLPLKAASIEAAFFCDGSNLVRAYLSFVDVKIAKPLANIVATLSL